MIEMIVGTDCELAVLPRRHYDPASADGATAVVSNDECPSNDRDVTTLVEEVVMAASLRAFVLNGIL